MLQNIIYKSGGDNENQIFEKAIVEVLSTKLKSLAAGKMGYSTSEVGDLVAQGILNVQ